MAEAEVGLRASLKDRAQTAAGLKGIKSGVDSVGRSAQTSGRLASIGARGFDVMRKAGKLAAAAIKLGFVAALGAGYAAVKLLRASFAEARESQKVGARTNNVIKTTGGVANVTAKQVGKLSTAISKKAGIDDEAIQTGANLLLTFKNIRNEAGKGNDIFNQTTQAAVDLSAAGFGSLDSASKMLGKALNDPVKGLTAMGRAGVTFSASQTDQIKKMVDQNNLLGAQKIILGEVTSQVGGAAAAQATWGDKAKVTFSNIEENLGKALLPLLNRTEKWFVQKGGPALQHYLRIFTNKGIPAIKGFVDQVRPLVNKYLPKVEDLVGRSLPKVGDKLKSTVDEVQTISDATKTMAPPLIHILKAFNSLPGWAKSAIGIGVGAGAVASKLGVPGLLGSRKLGGSGLLGLVTRAKPMPVFVTNPGFGGTGAGGAAAPGLVKRLFPTLTAGAAGTAAASGVEVGGGALALTGLYAGAPALGKYLGAKYRDSIRSGIASVFGGGGGSPTTGGTTGALSQMLLGPLRQADQLHSSLSAIGHIKVAPDVSPSGMTKAQAGADILDSTLSRIDTKPFMAHVGADTRAAMTALNGIQNYQLRDKYIHVHTVQGGTNAGASGDTPAQHGGGPAPTHRRAVPRVSPRASSLGVVDVGAVSPAAPIHVHVDIDKKTIATAVVDGVSDRAARR